MPWVKTGPWRINTDRILAISAVAGEDYYEIGDGADSVIRLPAEYGRALAAYIDRTAINLTATGDDAEFADFQIRGGEMTRAEWDSARRFVKEASSKPESWWEVKRNRERVSEVESSLLY